jgi:hypothetical protein
MNRGLRLVKLRFELPRGAYATLVLKRLLALTVGAKRTRPGSASADHSESGAALYAREPREPRGPRRGPPPR